jgi:thiopeptide-type bacteriocin biosynthesis protein
MNYEFYPKLIVRTPLFSFERFFKCADLDFLADPFFKEALFIASPDLARLVYNSEGELSEEVKLSLIRYYNRMCTRCTPFGLFAGCSVATWGYVTSVKISNKELFRRTRVDKELYSKIIGKINGIDEVFKNLSFSVNNTIYPMGAEIRMIEQDKVSGEFRIVSVTDSGHLNDFLKIIRNGNFKTSQIFPEALKLGFTQAESLEFLRVLVENHLLIPQTSATATTTLLLQKLKGFLVGLNAAGDRKRIALWKDKIGFLDNLIQSADQSVVGNEQHYYNISAFLGESGLHQPLNKLIQVDYSYSGNKNEIGFKVQKNLRKAIEILSLISVTGEDDRHFEKYKSKFFKKYEYQEIPLLIALDPEAGIDYLEGTTSFDNFLTQELFGFKDSGSLTGKELGYNSKLIKRKFEQAISNGSPIIELSDEDLGLMEPINGSFQYSTSVFFRLFGNDQLQIENVGGSSGINLFSRFTDYDQSLYEIAKDITNIEQDIAGDALIAEIIHEPEFRSGNVNLFPKLRNYAIPYFSEPDETDLIQIPLTDLLLSVKDGSFVLRSVKLDKTVLPRISSAYNYLKGSPIFRFFGDMQNQGSKTFKFDFTHIIADQAYYPRISYKNIIFSPAQWKIKSNEIVNKNGPLDAETLSAYLEIRKVPQFFIVSEGDNELLIDKNQSALMKIFLDLLKKRQSLFIKEFLFDPGQYPIVSGDGEFLNNQLIAILVNKEKPKQALPNTAVNISAMQRNFSIGSQWLFYKFYCGIITADKLLSNEIGLIVSGLKNKDLISNFFFIRYKDPEPHIRIRFLLKDISRISDVIHIIAEQTALLENSGQIWKSQVETYSRELERYKNAMIESEHIFTIDSSSMLAILSFSEVSTNYELRFAIGLRMVNDYLGSTCFSTAEKILFTRRMRAVLKADCSIDKETDKKINLHFRESSAKYFDFFTRCPTKFNRILVKRKNQINKIYKKLELKLQRDGNPDFFEDLLASHIHMSVNRLFISEQKIYEYIIYEYLFRYYTKEHSRMK